MFALTLAALVAVASPAPAAAPQCVPAIGFTGTVCTPATAGKHAAILMLGGSEGGDAMRFTAPQLAAAGYVAVSVAYFGAPGLPQTLIEIPVETVGIALDVVRKRDDVDSAHVGIMGISKGGELALLAASTYPALHAVVAVVASPFGWEGIAQGPSTGASSWTLAGKPVAFIPYSAKMGEVAATAFMNHTPMDLRVGYDASFAEHRVAADSAAFHMEKIAGPVMLLAADDDRIWNSPALSELGMQYLRDHKHPYADRYVHYAGAGHLFLFASPQRPMNTVEAGPITLLMGGTPAGDAAAQRDAWPQIMTFLATALAKS